MQAFNTQPDGISAWLSCGIFWDGSQGDVGAGPFASDYGYNVLVGDNAFINFNAVILDCARAASFGTFELTRHVILGAD